MYYGEVDVMALYEGMKLSDEGVPLQSSAEMATLSDTERTRIASDQYNRGMAAVKRGDFIQAVHHFKSADAYKSHPSTIWNIAKASYDTAKKYPHLRGALTESKIFFEAYRDRVPPAERSPDEKDVNTYLAEIEQALSEPSLPSVSKPRRKGRTGARKGRRKGRRKGKGKKNLESWWAKNWWVPVGGAAALAVIALLLAGGSKGKASKPLSISPPQ